MDNITNEILSQQIGFDWYGTITAYPEIFKIMADFMVKKPYIITAIRGEEPDKIRKYQNTVENYLAKYQFPYEKIIVVPFVDGREVPGKKLQVCRQFGITMFFDDRRDVVTLLNQNNIKGILVENKNG